MYLDYYFNVNEEKKRFELIAGNVVVKKISFKKAERKGRKHGMAAEIYARGYLAGLY